MSTSSTVTLAQIRAAAQSRADMVNSSFVSLTEWLQFINGSYKELYDLLVTTYGNDYYVASPFSIVTDGTNALYSLPADFYKLLGVDLLISGAQSQYVSLKPFSFSERNRQSNPSGVISRGFGNLRYRLNGNKIWLTPLPQAGQSLQLWYVPEPTSLSSDSDTLDGISGWEEYVEVDAAIKALMKEESDVSALMAQKTSLFNRIQTAAENRDAGQPATVADVRRNEMYGAPSLNPYGDPFSDWE